MDCKYQTKVSFWTDSIHIFSKAEMHKEDQALFFRILKPESELFKLFDFKSNKDEIYKIKIPSNRGYIGMVEVLLKNKYKRNFDESIYQFIILNGYDYFGGKT